MILVLLNRPNDLQINLLQHEQELTPVTAPFTQYQRTFQRTPLTNYPIPNLPCARTPMDSRAITYPQTRPEDAPTNKPRFVAPSTASTRGRWESKQTTPKLAQKYRGTSEHRLHALPDATLPKAQVAGYAGRTGNELLPIALAAAAGHSRHTRRARSRSIGSPLPRPRSGFWDVSGQIVLNFGVRRNDLGDVSDGMRTGNGNAPKRYECDGSDAVEHGGVVWG